MRKARFPTRALLVFSDGQDNYSVNTLEELTARFSDASVSMFLLAPRHWDANANHLDEMLERNRFSKFAKDTGGYVSPVHSLEEMMAAVAGVASTIRSSYLLQLSAPRRHSLKIEVPGIRPRPLVFFRELPESRP